MADLLQLMTGEVRFNGSDYVPALDDDRLTGQLRRIFDAIRGGAWLTLAEIEATTCDPQASISAQLRNLRKPRFGGFTIERRRRGPGTWEYRLRTASGH